jgi:hypothetical protein
MFYGHKPYSEEKLRAIRREYERTVDQHWKWAEIVEEDRDFYHGKQWSSEDTEYLAKQNRPALTFNLIQAKINHLIGAEQDNRKEAVVEAKDAGEVTAGIVMNRLKTMIYDDGEMDSIEGRVFEDCVTVGVGGLEIAVEPDPDDVRWVRVTFESVDPTDVLWDLACRRKDRSDARHMFRARWLTLDELYAQYPNLDRDELSALFAELSESVGGRFGGDALIEHTPESEFPTRPTLYYERRRNEARVIHCEYRCAERRHVAEDSQSGEQLDVNDEERRRLEAFFPGRFQFTTVYRDRWYWVEFMGNTILYDEESPLPFRDFSVIPCVAQVDDENLPYGKVRFLKDPQRDANKRHSQALHMISQQGAPGLIAEENALVDEHQAREAMRTGGTIKVKTGFWGKIEERKPPDIPMAVIAMEESAMRLMDLISSVFVDNLQEPRGIPEAAATSQLKHRQSLLTTIPLLLQFYAFRKRVCQRVLESVIALFPDEQIQGMLSGEARFLVRGGMVSDAQNGDAIPIPIRDMKTARYRVKIRATNDGSSTERLFQVQTLVQMAASNVPVDPEVIFELSGLPEGYINRLIRFSRKSQEAQGQSLQFQMQQAAQQIAQQYQLDQAKLMIDAGAASEKKRAAMAKEWEASRKDSLDHIAKVAAIWQQADATEKQFIAEMIGLVHGESSSDSEGQREGAPN